MQVTTGNTAMLLPKPTLAFCASCSSRILWAWAKWSIFSKALIFPIKDFIDGSSTRPSSAASSCFLQAVMFALGRATGAWTATSAVLLQLLGFGVAGGWGTAWVRGLPKELSWWGGGRGSGLEEVAEREMDGGGSLLLLAGLLLDGES